MTSNDFKNKKSKIRRQNIFVCLEVVMLTRNFVAILLVLTSFSISIFAQDARTIAKTVLPSVVLLEMHDIDDKPISQGSGFFVKQDIIATNFHVIDGASKGYVKLQGSKYLKPIEGVVAYDREIDLALLKVSGIKGTPLAFASVAKVEVGQDVFALGSPKGLEGTISPGIVSSKLRDTGREKLIQITAPISPGSSGGPVVNKQGQVIGVAVASLKEGQNLNFAIPASYLSEMMDNVGKVSSFTSISGTSGSPQEEKSPSFEETTAWLTYKLEGVEGRKGNLLHEIIKKFQFHGCTMDIVILNLFYKNGTVSDSWETLTQIPLGSVPEMDAGKEKYSGQGFITMHFDKNKKVSEITRYSDGSTETELISELTIITGDVDESRIVKAFANLDKFCGRLTKEPF